MANGPSLASVIEGLLRSLNLIRACVVGTLGTVQKYAPEIASLLSMKAHVVPLSVE
jgi:hypothetical protein